MKNSQKQICRFVYVKKPRYFGGNHRKPSSYKEFIALQINNNLYYIEEGILQTARANAKFVRLHPTEAIVPDFANQILKELYYKHTHP